MWTALAVLFAAAFSPRARLNGIDREERTGFFFFFLFFGCGAECILHCLDDCHGDASLILSVSVTKFN